MGLLVCGDCGASGFQFVGVKICGSCILVELWGVNKFKKVIQSEEFSGSIFASFTGILL